MRSLVGVALLAACLVHLAHAQADEPSYHVVKRVVLGGEGGWDYLTADSAAHRLYISRSSHVMVVDTESLKVVGDIPNTAGVHGIAIAPKAGKGYASNGGDSTVTVFDLKTLKETDRIKVGARPDAIIFDPFSNRVFTFNAGTSDASAIDVATGKVAGSVPLGGKPEFAQSDERGTIYVNIEDTSEVVAFDAKELKVKTRWPLAPGEGPSGLAIDRKAHRLFSVCDGGKMVVSDAEAGKVVATPAIGNGPDAAAFDAKLGLAFSSNGQDGTLTVIKTGAGDKYYVVETAQTDRGARTMTLDPRTHLVYLVTAKPQAAPAGAAGGRRRSYEPGSFTLLVVGR